MELSNIRREYISYAVAAPLLGVGAACFAMGLVLPDDGWGRLFRWGFVVFGLIEFAMTAILTLLQIGVDADWHDTDINLTRLRGGLPPISTGARVVPAPARVTVRRIERKGPEATSETVWDYANPPSAEFIGWVFEMAEANDKRRVPGERAAIAVFGQDANAWLDALEEQAVIEAAWDAANAARRLSDGQTLEDALAVFGHAPPAPAAADAANSSA